MKRILALLLFVPVCFSNAQTICDSVTVTPDTAYIYQLTDISITMTLTFTGQQDISYSYLFFEFPDSSNMDINVMAVTNGIPGPFVFVHEYDIIYNNPAIPPNTIVNCSFRVFHPGIPDPTIDCYKPVTFIINSSTGISSPLCPLLSDRISVFPNPFNDLINIKANENELMEIILYDVLTRKIFNQSFTNSISLNTEQFANGIYIYEIRNKNGVIKKGKVVKE